MKFEQHAALVMQTNRLAAASSAAVACDAAMKEEHQIFDFAGQRFAGPDALLIKRVLLTALTGIAEEATNALKRGGIVFEGDQVDTGQQGRRKSPAKKAV